jgi:hypothetical protein
MSWLNESMQALATNDWPGQALVIFATRSKSTMGRCTLGGDMGMLSELSRRELVWLPCLARRRNEATRNF